MLQTLINIQDSWHKLPEVVANPSGDQLTDIIRAVINSCWEHRPEQIIIDKNRGWGKNMPASTILFEQEIKMVATTRDLPSIMASWLSLIRKNESYFMDQFLIKKGFRPSDENRMAEMWFNMVKDCLEALVIAKKQAGNRLLLIDYDSLIAKPEATLRKIEQFLGLPEHSYDLNSIQSDTKDDDLAAWGLDGMHSIRNKLEKTSKDPREVLGDSLYNRFVELEKHYFEIYE